jgi:hypothetical protein
MMWFVLIPISVLYILDALGVKSAIDHTKFYLFIHVQALTTVLFSFTFVIKSSITRSVENGNIRATEFFAVMLHTCFHL